MAIMPYADWMAGTKRGILTPRSAKLQAIDSALKKYEASGKTRALLIDVKNTLDAWIAEKGASWRGSVRNKNGTVESLQKQIGSLLGPGFAINANSLQQKRHALAAPPPVRAIGNSLSSAAFAQRFAGDVKSRVHQQWTSLTAEQRATRMHRALADLFPSMNVPAPGLSLVADLGGAVGQFNFTTWKLDVASQPFEPNATPSRDECVEAAKTIYHEGRHCEQWFHMARYASSGGSLTAQEVAQALGIPLAIATNALSRKMDARDGMFLPTKAWFQSVYDRSGREITLTALALKHTGNAALLANMRAQNHQRYSGGLPEEADAWGTEALLDAAYVWP